MYFKSLLPIAATLLAVACGPEDPKGPVKPENGELCFEAAIENCMTKASVINSGETRWQKGDEIFICCEDGSAVKFTLDGTGETRKAFFKGNVPASTKVGNYAYYSAAGISGDSFSVNLPSVVSPSSFGVCSSMIAGIGENEQIEFKHALAYITLLVKNINTAASTIVLSSENSLSGSFSAPVGTAMQSGIPAQKGTESISISLSGITEDYITVNIAIPAGEYLSLVATQYNSAGKAMNEVEILSSAITVERASLRSLECSLPDYEEIVEIEGSVFVADIYWAKGNLQFVEAAATSEGFQNGWRIAPSQYEYVNMNNAVALNTKVDFKPGSYDAPYDHFNWGGIKDPFTCLATSSAVVAVGGDISGKMYTNQECTVETADFSKATYGDLAFWASKGVYRMPTEAELSQLATKANVQYAQISIAEGKVVSGLYFSNPENGENPKVSDEVVTLTEEMLGMGLFLPKAGRRYNKTECSVNVQGTQGVYWSSTSITGDGADQPCYGSVLSIQNAVLKFPYWNKAFDAKAGFCIRPVRIVTK